MFDSRQISATVAERPASRSKASPRRRAACPCATPVRRSVGLGELMGLEESYQIFPDGNTALQKGYGILYYQNGQVWITGPYGPLRIFDTQTVYPSFHGAGYLYTQNGKLFVGGPAGPVAVNSPPRTATTSVTAAPSMPVASPAPATISTPVYVPPPPSTAPQPSPSPPPPSAPQGPVYLDVPIPTGQDPAVTAALESIKAGGPGAVHVDDKPGLATAPGQTKGILDARVELPVVGSVPTVAVGAALVGTVIVLVLRRRHA